MRILYQSLCLTIVAFFSVSLRAAVILSDGTNITGATGVIVDGNSYDVAFVDDSCVALFSGCDESSDFVFNTSALAELASQALLDQVLLDISATETFDSDPEKMVGCTNSGLCRALTIYALTSTPGTVAGVTADNNQFNADDVVTPNIGIGDSQDLADVSIATYAVWTASGNAVPLSPSMYFMLLSISGLVLAKQRSKSIQPNG